MNELLEEDEFLMAQAANFFMSWTDDSVFDESEENTHGGSKVGRKPNINRGILDGEIKLYADYFAQDCVYDANIFKRRFRISKERFNKI